MSAPSRERYLRFAQVMAEAEWEVRYGRPQRARETARAWVGVIELMVMGSSQGYTRAYMTPYEPPRTVVVPAAPKISITELGFSVTYLPAGSPFRFFHEHASRVLDLFKTPLTISEVPLEQYTREVTMPEDRVLITWHTALAPVFNDGRYPEPFNVFLLTPDGKERETSRITTRIVAVFSTEAEATQWVQTRAAELQVQHDRNHARQCRDKACAKRGHTYEPRCDD